MEELHIIIIWQNGRYKENEIAADIEKNFSVVRSLEIEWTKKNVARNFTRFYGVNLPDKSFKEKECGTGPFRLFIVRDTNPVYEERETSHGKERVNVNLFDAKTRYREWTGGGHKIHATNSPREVDHDLTLLLGINGEDFLRNHTETFTSDSIKRDITGTDGWNSLSELFYVLNNTVEYVIMRGAEEIHTGIFADDHRDIDLLLSNKEYQNAVFIINGVSCCNPFRPHELVNIQGYDYYLDIWQIEKYYFDWDWSFKMLAQRERKDGIYVLSPDDDFYCLLYHCLILKGKIADDYLKRLESHRKRLQMQQKEWDEILCSFIRENDLDIPVPVDKSVSIHLDGDIKDYIYSIGAPIKYLHSCLYDKPQFISKVFERENSFVKIGNSTLIENEIRFLYELGDDPHFPKVISEGKTRKGEIQFEQERIEGVMLADFMWETKHLRKEFIESFVHECLSILLLLAKKQITHRDFTPSNIIVKENGTCCNVGLIDFGWAIYNNEIETCPKPLGLGDRYAPPQGYSDLYMLSVVFKEMPFRKMPYVRSIRKVLKALYSRQASQEQVVATLEKLLHKKLNIRDLYRLLRCRMHLRKRLKRQKQGK